MQIVPRYLVNQRNFIVANEGTQATEYRQVYQKTLNVYRGIDNKIEFQLLNTDQKPVSLNNRTVYFVAFDETQRLIIEHTGNVINSNKGLFTITVTENDLLNLKQQYLNYNIYLKDANNQKLLTYADTHYRSSGTIFVNGNAFPGPLETYSISQFTGENIQNDIYYSEEITAEPALNGNEALHTAAIYSNGFIGNVTVQATLENQISGNSQAVDWVDLKTVAFTGAETEPVNVNFNGVFSFVRFKTDANPKEKINKILLRN
jgi:hypothetical protein